MRANGEELEDGIKDTHATAATETDTAQAASLAACPADHANHAKPAKYVSRRDVLRGAAGVAVAAPLVGLDEAVGQRRRRRGATTKANGSAAGTGSRRPLFFSPAEFALLDELTELIIPTDEHSPGARAAGVALFIDRRIAETNPAIADYAKERQTWRNGLKLVDGLSQEMNGGKAFMQASPEQRIAVLTRMAEEEPRPQPPLSQPNPPRPGEQPLQQPPGQPGEIYKEGGQNRPEQKKTESPRKSEGEFFTFLKTRAARVYYTSEIGIHKELEYKGNQYLQEFVGYDMNGKFTDAPKGDVSRRSGD